MHREWTDTGTAGWIAAARARESTRPDRLFDDPWAGALAGERGRARLRASEQVGGENRFLPVRTRFFDDVVVEASSWAAQLVLLGAGLDTRAYRLRLPERMSVYEIDLPGLLALKQSALRTAGACAVCNRHVVAADLQADWSGALLTAGFDPGLPTVWLAEGLVFYLSRSAVERLLTQAAALSTARAVIALDAFGTGLLRLPALQPTVQRRAADGLEAPFCTDEPIALLGRCGWPECVITEPGQSRANYGRLPPLPDNWSGGTDPCMRTYLIVATRTEPGAEPDDDQQAPHDRQVPE